MCRGPAAVIADIISGSKTEIDFKIGIIYI